MSTALWWIFGVLCVSVGFYPVIYFLIDRTFGLLSSKPEGLLENQAWNVCFYGHIIFGGIALLIGWTQFSFKIRQNKPMIHRNTGKIYILSAVLSSLCSLFIAQFATGGLSNTLAFSLNGILWLSTTIYAFYVIRGGNISSHKNAMIYSYALCFSAVTLRIWLPLLTMFTHNFDMSYKIVGWLCWLPNIIVAYIIVNWSEIIPMDSTKSLSD